MTEDERRKTEAAVPGQRLAVGARISGDALLASALCLASLILYATTAAPSVATLFDDSLEFQVVLPTLGISHPSGYPLYTLLGKLFTSLLPFRDPAGRVNLLSSLTAGLAVGLLYLAARRLAGNRWAALVPALAFAISPVWWAQATIAEVYALHGMLVALFINCLLRWEETNSRNAAWLLGAALTFGLGLTHHRMIVLLLPAAAVFVTWADRTLLGQPRRWPPLIICGLAPLLLYLYLLIRGQTVGSLDGTFAPTLAGMWRWITAAGYSVFLTGNPFGVQRDAGFFLNLIVEQCGVLICLAAVLGLITSWRLGKRRPTLLLLATVAQVGFGVLYKVEDVAVFFIPVFMLIALWAALGLGPLFDSVSLYAAGLARALRLPAWLRPAVLTVAALALAASLLGQPARAAVRNYPQLDRSRDWRVYDLGQDMLASSAAGGQVVGLLGETTLVRYFRDVLGQRGDVTVVPADAEATRFAAVEAALARGWPVYLTRDLPGAAARYSMDAAGPLIAVSLKAQPAPPPAGQALAAGIVLTDARSTIRQTHAGPVLRLTLTWAAAMPIHEELKVSARLLDAAGQTLVVQDRVPVHFAYPTTAWVPGELVVDVYDLALPRDAVTGPCDILLVLYQAVDGRELGRVQLTDSVARSCQN